MASEWQDKAIARTLHLQLLLLRVELLADDRWAYSILTVQGRADMVTNFATKEDATLACLAAARKLLFDDYQALTTKEGEAK